ncbi:protein cordon-bleu-like [Crotalus tigris]|uniref:protein cordon-bleu-like n=1 Tax=Crotalus tigris TaxID=88082 RepID=UPI00192F2435|nr:protein cordon-bleu-like [Crotalus tigris]
MKNIQNDSKSQSVVIELNGASMPLLQKAENPSDVSLPVPVTIINEVPENYTVAHSNTEEEEKMFSKIETNENIPVKLIDLVKLININKNIESVKLKGASAKNPDEKESDSIQSPWRHCINNRIKNYHPKTGLTTFKVVPPKPRIRDFDRNESLYTGAIKIDELGNLVTPNSNGARKIIVNATSKETLFGRGKEYKRSNSMEKQTEQLPIDHSVEMPQRKSSNDYLTTTVANSNDLTQFKTIQGKHSHVKSSNIPSAVNVNQTTLKKDEKLDNAENKLCSNRIEDNIYNIFGAKKKFKPVIQKSVPKDTSLHSALMEAIQNTGGKDKLRKVNAISVNLEGDAEECLVSLYDEVASEFHDVDAFMQELRNQFEDPTKARKADVRIWTIKQEKRVIADYIRDFCSVVAT